MRTKVFAGVFVALLGLSVWGWFMASLGMIKNEEVHLFFTYGVATLIIYLMYSVCYFTIRVIKWVINET